MYRGEVLGVNEKKCCVIFIDYGNCLNVKHKYLIPDVLGSEVPPFCQKFRLDGSPIGPSGKIDTSMFDCLYSMKYGKEISVEIHNADREIYDASIIKRCSIVVDQTIIRTYDDLKAYEQACIVVE